MDIDGDAASAVAAEELGPDVLPLAADVSSEQDVQGYFAAAAEHFGRVDSLHNNAGIEGPLAPLADFETDAFERLVRVNYFGIFFNLRQMLRTARRSGTARDDRQHVIGYGAARGAPARRLRLDQGGDHRAHPGGGARERGRGGAGQRGGPRAGGYAAVRSLRQRVPRRRG